MDSIHAVDVRVFWRHLVTNVLYVRLVYSRAYGNFMLLGFSGALAKLRKATVSFVTVVCPSIGTTLLPLDGF